MRGHAAASQVSGNFGPSDLEGFLRWAARGSRGDDVSLKAWVDLAEAWRITQALQRHRGNRSRTARELGIGRRTLYSKMEKLGIAPSWGVEDEH